MANVRHRCYTDPNINNVHMAPKDAAADFEALIAGLKYIAMTINIIEWTQHDGSEGMIDQFQCNELIISLFYDPSPINEQGFSNNDNKICSEKIKKKYYVQMIYEFENILKNALLQPKFDLKITYLDRTNNDSLIPINAINNARINVDKMDYAKSINNFEITISIIALFIIPLNAKTANV